MGLFGDHLKDDKQRKDWELLLKRLGIIAHLPDKPVDYEKEMRKEPRHQRKAK